MQRGCRWLSPAGRLTVRYHRDATTGSSASVPPSRGKTGKMAGGGGKSGHDIVAKAAQARSNERCKASKNGADTKTAVLPRRL